MNLHEQRPGGLCYCYICKSCQYRKCQEELRRLENVNKMTMCNKTRHASPWRDISGKPSSEVKHGEFVARRTFVCFHFTQGGRLRMVNTRVEYLFIVMILFKNSILFNDLKANISVPWNHRTLTPAVNILQNSNVTRGALYPELGIPVSSFFSHVPIKELCVN